MTPALVVVLGEALVDVFPDGARVAGGAPFNVACWLAALGAPVQLLARVAAGDDADTSCLLDAAARAGLSSAGWQRDAALPTGRVEVTLSPGDGPRFRIGTPAAWDAIDAHEAVAQVQAAQPALIYFNSLAQRDPRSRAAVAAVLEASPALRFADLNLRAGADTPELAALVLSQAQWVKVNHEELARLLHWFAGLPPDAGAAQQATAVPGLMRRFAIERLLVTAGADGWYTFNSQGERDAQGPAHTASPLVDSVGAGDAFAATVLLGLARRWPLAYTLQAAARLASAVCSLRGALPQDAAFFHHWRQRLGGAHPAPQDDPRVLP